jgi:hypothetical protein
MPLRNRPTAFLNPEAFTGPSLRPLRLVRCVVSCSQMRGVWSTDLIGRTHFNGTQDPPPKSESPASKSFRHSGITAAFKTTFDVFTSVGPDNSFERLTERSVGLVADQPSDIYELLVTLLE